MKLKIFRDTRSHLVWAVRIVEHGDNYGLNDALTHKGERPLVEFYDTRHEHTDLGQFVTRYFLGTLIDGDGGLNLDGGVPSWNINEPCMNRIRDWLRRQA